MYNAEYMSLVPYSLVHGEARERHVGTKALVLYQRRLSYSYMAPSLLPHYLLIIHVQLANTNIDGSTANIVDPQQTPNTCSKINCFPGDSGTNIIVPSSEPMLWHHNFV